MSDGLNEARALRVVEIINDFRTLQIHIPQLKSDPPVGEENVEGYVLMSRCFVEGQQLLAAQFNTDSLTGTSGNGEAERIQLQRIILDASCRRFQAHKVYLKMAAAKRWAVSRNRVLQGRRAEPRHAEALAAIDKTLRDELSTTTDNYIINDLRNADMRAGHWLDDDPSLSIILNWIRSHS